MPPIGMQMLVWSNLNLSIYSLGKSRSNNNDDTAQLVGIIIGTFCVVSLIMIFVVMVYCCWRFKRTRNQVLIVCAVCISCTCCTCLLCAHCTKKKSKWVRAWLRGIYPDCLLVAVTAVRPVCTTWIWPVVNKKKTKQLINLLFAVSSNNSVQIPCTQYYVFS